MKADSINLDGKAAGSIDLDDAIFGLEARADILHRVVRWQRNNAQAGTHSTLVVRKLSTPLRRSIAKKVQVAHATVLVVRQFFAVVVFTRAQQPVATAMS